MYSQILFQPLIPLIQKTSSSNSLSDPLSTVLNVNTPSTVWVSTPANQSQISGTEANFIASLPTDKQKLVKDMFASNINQSTDSFVASNEGQQLYSYLRDNPTVAQHLFENADCNNSAFRTQAMSDAIPVGSTVKYVFPDGSTIIRSNTVSPVKMPAIANMRTSSTSLTSMSGNFVNDNTWTDSLGVTWVTDDLYVYFNCPISSDGSHYNVNIYNVQAAANSFGIGGAASNGDAHTTNNWGPYSSATASFTNTLGLQDLGTSWTEVLTTSFNGFINGLGIYQTAQKLV